ncbi:bifunctional hydroxymethylpyrimidine kinase/phosphomethylpyrimidine kinase [Flammeovirga yaeyamensis]|uniref:bifunctional hydroxymethylpyrimidine kinase/phosphomethylpyrimidine kinase n=1 Tax=Flammeovirga yaeyamensis TaxID=367791 RepID=UPI00146D1E3E|nr:bifunctional hydroxymethylpyrimidine kinase/phosphomethylpyrimidine kinase [Flammeovirga yaeyamensis]MBB3697384.1 hydroxymethylpyrimidine/phosphomethylpyrimidine kinase [Flammeovirga yaeyamensis]NMF36078.1 bifunctional hydroxymethylpyrimidine kinase/phosphomethylpyrimidine kinase [Flammeovirga yaeyamensis]
MENIKTPYQTVLTIAGSDSGGCAGIQADIKSISACGAYAASVITATTAQNTQGVTDIHAIPVDHLEKQLEAVFSDIEFDAIKIGMLHSCEVINAIASKLSTYKAKNIVLDPVMVATSGDKLITDEAIDCLKQFLPKATVITPNRKEAEILVGHAIDKDNCEVTAREIGTQFKTSVVLKGGHLDPTTNDMLDILYEYKTDQLFVIKNPLIDTNNTHGTGCSLSSSIATFLGKGDQLEEAVRKACQYVNQSIAKGKDKALGRGNGPINHFGLK